MWLCLWHTVLYTIGTACTLRKKVNDLLTFITVHVVAGQVSITYELLYIKLFLYIGQTK